MSMMRDKVVNSRDSMRNINRGNVIVKTPDLLDVPIQFGFDDTNSRNSTITNSDTESQKDTLSLVDSFRGNASDKGQESSDDSSDFDIDPKERSRLKLVKDRKNALDELLLTEQNYILDLEQIVQGYMELIKKDDVPKPPTLVGKELMVFGNLQQIYEWHKNTFQPEMEKNIDNPQKLGTIFTKYEKKFYMYVKYCENKPKSEDITYENLEYFEQLREILDHKLQLADMLIKPVQRIMKYELLLKAIMKYTEKAGEDIKNIQRAIEVMCIIPRAANDMMNVGRLQGFDGKVTAQGRLLLQDTMDVCEQLTKNTLERSFNFKERKAFLFEQIIIFSKTVDKRKNATGGNSLHYLYCGSIRVNKLLLTEMPNNPLSFRLVDKNPKSPAQYMLQCKHASTKKNWVTQIKILLDNQTDFLKALQSPISYQRECSRINSGDTAVTLVEMDSKESSSKKPPKTKMNKTQRSFKNLFIKQITHHNPQVEGSYPKTGTANSSPNPASSTCRKFSLPFFESIAALAIHRTPEVESKSKWSMLSSLTRRKNSDVSSISPQSTESNNNNNFLTISNEHKHMSVSNENIWIDKSSDSERDDNDVQIMKREPKTASNILTRNPLLFMDFPKKQNETAKDNNKESKISFVKHLENASVAEGSSIKLNCQLSTNSFAYSISWVGPNNESLVGRKDVVMENRDGCLSLELLHVSLSQSGEYKCKICCNKICVMTSCHLRVLPEILPKPKRKTTLNSIDLTTLKNELHSSCNEKIPKEQLSWSCLGFEEKYELQRTIEKGRFSVLYECQERLSRCRFVAKSYSKVTRTKEAVTREAFLSFDTDHPSIVQALKLYENAHSFFILFPFLPNRNKLFDYIINMYSFDESQALNLAQQMFSALSHLHERNILYLSVKPESIDVDLSLPTNPILKLTDFSESRSIDPAHPYIHPITGDSEFTPPEVFHNAPLTCSSDIWNGAVLLYAMLSGTTPFYDADVEVVRRKIVTISYDFPKPSLVDIHPSVVSFISSALVMPPSQRPSARSCSEKCVHLKEISNKTRIDKSAISDFVQRRHKINLV